MIYPEITEFEHQSVSATFTIGLGRGFSGALFDREDYLKFLQKYQSDLWSQKKCQLPAMVEDCEFVSGGLREPHLRFNFLNLPQNNLLDTFYDEVVSFAMQMMTHFEQKRTVLQLGNKVQMLQTTDNMDPKSRG